MAMFGYFQNGFAAAEPPKPAKAPELPKPAAPKAVAKPVNRKTSPLRPSRPGLWQNLFGRGSGKK